MRRLVAALILALTLSAPALADEKPTTAPPGTSKPASDEPNLSVGLLPLPFMLIYGLASYTNFPIGPLRGELSARGGYVWSTLQVFDPDTTQNHPLTANQDANYWNFVADFGVYVLPHWTLFLDGYASGGGITQAPGYDQSLAGGTSVTWGPMLQYSTLDNRDFPLSGQLVQLEWAPGYHWGAENVGFQRAWGQAAHFFPLGSDKTLALRATAQAGWPRLPWTDKLTAGGPFNARGYDWNRFTGDRLLSGTLEYRHLFLPDILAFVGVKNFPLPFGLAWEVYADAGRAWESTRGVPFLSDIRVGGGTGLMLTADKAPLGRLELNVSSEGFYPTAGFASSF